MPFEDCTAALARRDVLAGAVCTEVILACIYDFQDYHDQQLATALSPSFGHSYAELDSSGLCHVRLSRSTRARLDVILKTRSPKETWGGSICCSQYHGIVSFRGLGACFAGDGGHGRHSPASSTHLLLARAGDEAHNDRECTTAGSVSERGNSSSRPGVILGV